MLNQNRQKLDSDKVFEVLFQDKLADCKIDVFVYPNNTWLEYKTFVPVPPHDIDNIPDVILDAFILVIAEPEPIKLDADKVFDV